MKRFAIPRSFRWLCASCLLLTGLALALAFASSNRQDYPDEVDYHTLALSLRDGNGFSTPMGHPTAYRPPGYPFFLRCLYSIHAQPVTGKIINAFLLGGSALFMGLLFRRAGGRRIALPALLLFLYPVSLYSTSLLYPQTLGGFLLLGILFLLVRERRRAIHLALAGLMLGVLILSIPAFMLTAPVLALIVMMDGHHPHAQRLQHVVVLTGFTLLIAAPWTFRNYRLFGAFIPVSTNSGLNLYLGNSANTRPGSGVNVDYREVLAETEGMNEFETDRHFKTRALQWMSRHPREAASLYAGKVLNYFHFRNKLATRLEGKVWVDTLMFATYYPLLLLFLLRLLFCRSKPLHPIEKTAYLLTAANVFASALFFTRIRFRLPFDLLMLLVDSLFIDHILHSFRSHFALVKPKPLAHTSPNHD